MNNIKLITTDKDILEFENKREEVFSGTKKYDSIEKTTYGNLIRDGEMLAFGLYDEENIIGGVLTSVNDSTLFIHRLFIDEKNRSKGYGSKLLKYLEDRKRSIEDYFGFEIDEVIAEPIPSSIRLFYNNDYHYCGDKVYKKLY